MLKAFIVSIMEGGFWDGGNFNMCNTLSAPAAWDKTNIKNYFIGDTNPYSYTLTSEVVQNGLYKTEWQDNHWGEWSIQSAWYYWNGYTWVAYHSEGVTKDIGTHNKVEYRDLKFHNHRPSDYGIGSGEQIIQCVYPYVNSVHSGVTNCSNGRTYQQ